MWRCGTKTLPIVVVIFSSWRNQQRGKLGFWRTALGRTGDGKEVLGPSLDREEEEEGEAFSFKWYFFYLLDAFLKKSGFSDQFNQETGAKFLWTLHQMKEGFLSSLLHLSRENRRERERERGREQKCDSLFRTACSMLSFISKHALSQSLSLPWAQGPGSVWLWNQFSSACEEERGPCHALPCPMSVDGHTDEQMWAS